MSPFILGRVSRSGSKAEIQWDRVFESVADKHPDTDCGVFFCGPAGLGDTLKGMCGKYTSPMGCRFYFGKEVSELRFGSGGRRVLMLELLKW